MDVTWAVNLKAEFSYDSKYLWADPSVFIEDHLPDDPFWQLLDNPVSLTCFINKENCTDKINLKRNYGQHITPELTLDTFTKKLNFFKRVIGYNNDNTERMSEAAYFYLDTGKKALEDYYKLKEQQKKTFDIFKDKDDILFPLKKAKLCFEASSKLYAKIHKKNGELNTPYINFNTSKQVETEKEIRMVEQYFKQTKK